MIRLNRQKYTIIWPVMMACAYYERRGKQFTFSIPFVIRSNEFNETRERVSKCYGARET